MNRAIRVAVLIGVAACGDRRAPRRTDAAVAAPVALAPAFLERVTALTIADATVRVLARGDRDLAMAIERGGVRADLTIAGCLRCAPIDRAAWEAQRPALIALHAPTADAVPPVAGARLDLAVIELSGARAIAIDARRGVDAPARALVHWNDGVVQIQAVCDVTALADGAVNPCTAIATDAVAGALAAAKSDGSR